ncbi:MAG TPA: TrmH family RNA methyltransferase, partial [Calditrichia bacterium]|nr:TrmH family RNA methyltransferase [Calditrichia bacterium]
MVLIRKQPRGFRITKRFSGEIPGNTGAVGRTCVALDIELVLIHPLGFVISDKRLKRSGLDYWQHVRLAEYR